jgi:hypothetical protein
VAVERTPAAAGGLEAAFELADGALAVGLPHP